MIVACNYHDIYPVFLGYSECRTYYMKGMTIMFKRITALALVLVLALSVMPPVNAFGRQPLEPKSVDQCCHTIREEALSPDYFRPAFEGKLRFTTVVEARLHGLRDEDVDPKKKRIKLKYRRSNDLRYFFILQ